VEATLTDTVLYLYGLLPASTELAGLTAVEEGARVFLIESDGIACAASAVPASAYQRPADSFTAAEQLEWVTPRAWRHHDVLRHLHNAGTVVPLKFGTLSAGVPQVEALLRDRRVAIARLLERLRGKDEWTLHVAIDEEALSAALLREEPSLQALKDEERRLPEGRAYFVRKRLQKLVVECLDRRRELVCAETWDRLTQLGVEALPCASPGDSFSLLVERARFVELEAALADLESIHAPSHLRFELVGPWPPYSFATTILGEA